MKTHRNKRLLATLSPPDMPCEASMKCGRNSTTEKSGALQYAGGQQKNGVYRYHRPV
jgi:hypothetical protein